MKYAFLGSFVVLFFCQLPLSIAMGQPPHEDLPEEALARIRTHIHTLLSKPQPELYARHLKSVLALCEQDVLKLQFAGPRQDEQAKELLGYLTTIEMGLNDDGDRPETYLTSGRRALTLARASRLDDTIQFCTVGLPAHWDPNKAYPLFVQLHGAGPRMPLAYVNFTFQPHTNQPLSTDEKPGAEAIVLSPWMRGNRAWTENSDAETDIWEAIDDVKSFAKLDADRWYIAGHSGGGDDTWAIIQRTPDLWAAAGMLAGATYGAPVDLGLVSNIRSLPFYIWSGDHDLTHRLPSAEEARDALKAVGNPPKFVVAPGVGHMYRGEDAAAMSDWLIQHVRHRPDHFSFIIDTPRHRGIWGVSIPRKYPYDQLVAEPRVRFECWIAGATVRVRTWDAKKLVVDFGERGLNMSGNVTLMVNGKRRFEGPVPDKPVSLTWEH